MLFVLGLFMACLSQVGFAASGDSVCLDVRSVAGDDEVLRQRAVPRSTDAYTVSLEESKQDQFSKNMIRGFVVTTGGIGLGGLVGLMGYCVWQDPSILIAPLIGSVIVSAVAVVNLVVGAS